MGWGAVIVASQLCEQDDGRIAVLRLGWLSTGRGEGSRGFLELIQETIENGDLDARIEFVFSNREAGEAEGSDQFFRMVESYGLPLVTLSSQRYRREHGGGPFSRHRGPFHEEVMRAISSFEPDICVLAGYMLITSPEMARRYPTLNCHPALPGGPVGTWQQVIRKLIEDRAGESGVNVHVATEVLDAGPVVAYCRFPIRGGEFDPLWKEVEGRPTDELRAEGEEQPLFRLIRQEGVKRERPMLLEALRLLADGRVEVKGGRAVDADGAPAAAKDLTSEVERHLLRVRV